MSSYFSMSIYRRKQVRNLTNLHGSGNARFCHMAADMSEERTFTVAALVLPSPHLMFSLLIEDYEQF